MSFRVTRKLISEASNHYTKWARKVVFNQYAMAHWCAATGLQVCSRYLEHNGWKPLKSSCLKARSEIMRGDDHRESDSGQHAVRWEMWKLQPDLSCPCHCLKLPYGEEEKQIMKLLFFSHFGRHEPEIWNTYTWNEILQRTPSFHPNVPGALPLLLFQGASKHTHTHRQREKQYRRDLWSGAECSRCQPRGVCVTTWPQISKIEILWNNTIIGSLDMELHKQFYKKMDCNIFILSNVMPKKSKNQKENLRKNCGLLKALL